MMMIILKVVMMVMMMIMISSGDYQNDNDSVITERGIFCLLIQSSIKVVIFQQVFAFDARLPGLTNPYQDLTPKIRDSCSFNQNPHVVFLPFCNLITCKQIYFCDGVLGFGHWDPEGLGPLNV